MAGDRPRGRRRLATVRARTTLLASLTVGVATVAAALGLVLLVRASLTENLDDVARSRATDVAALLRDGRLPTTLTAGADDGALTQVVDGSRKVLVASPGAPATRPMGAFLPGTGPTTRTVRGLGSGDFGRARVVALPAQSGGRPVVVYAAVSLEPVDEAVDVMSVGLTGGVPLLLLVVGVTTWRVTGRALRPVEQIRAEVAELSSRSLDRRVPVPAGGDEIQRLAVTMNDMLGRLEASAQRERRFVADASHELQSPLAAARTQLEVALAHPEQANWQATAERVAASQRRMEALVRDLLYLARIDEQAPRPDPAPLDLDAVVLDEVAALRPTARLPIDTGGVSAAPVVGRRDDLARAVRNLLENADRHARSRVTIRLSATDQLVTLTIADDGPGIAPEHRDRVFERFTRLEGDRSRDSGGSGLGLAIVRHVITEHGGSVAIGGDERLGGAAITLQLPAAPVAPAGGRRA